MNKRLYVLCGIPASGKSTWIREHEETLKKESPNGKVLVVSRDKIRFSLLKEGEPYFSKESLVYKEYIRQIAEGLNCGDTVVADATHLNAKSRTRLLNSLGGALEGCEVIAICMIVSPALALKRNHQRSGREFVPPSQIIQMYVSYNTPTFEESFNRIFIYTCDDLGRREIIEKIEKIERREG